MTVFEKLLAAFGLTKQSSQNAAPDRDGSVVASKRTLVRKRQRLQDAFIVSETMIKPASLHLARHDPTRRSGRYLGRNPQGRTSGRRGDTLSAGRPQRGRLRGGVAARKFSRPEIPVSHARAHPRLPVTSGASASRPPGQHRAVHRRSGLQPQSCPTAGVRCRASEATLDTGRVCASLDGLVARPSEMVALKSAMRT